MKKIDNKKVQIKNGKLHPKNTHKGKYDFDNLVKNLPQLEKFVKKNPRGEKTIDFSDGMAVKILNKALLKTYYDIKFWDIPKGFLCPPIPGRADYIHYLAELMGYKKGLKVLDIGTGANMIYPIIGCKSYDWKFTASDIDPKSIGNAKMIVKENSLDKNIELRLQKDKNSIFTGIIKEEEIYDLTMCNPPFHSSLEDAMKANREKISNLAKKTENKDKKDNLNFGGQKAELWCKGGEKLFLKKMVKDSLNFKDMVKYFSSLISKKENVMPTSKQIKKLGGTYKIVEMSQGQKKSRIIIWSFQFNLDK